MGQKTKIEWCDVTWNPIVGCYHGCEYCYARRIAERFGGYDANVTAGCSVVTFKDKMGRPYHQVRTGQYKWTKSGKLVDAAYPFGFEPTLYEYKLKEPRSWKRPKTIFVCSMADLFGDWVPDEWIQDVFDACKAAPQHRYLFLTKNPGRFADLHHKGILPDNDRYWFGATFDHSNWRGHKIFGRPKCGIGNHDAGDFYFPAYPKHNRFVSFEPLLYDIGGNIGSTGAQWHIIGAETGKRKGKAEVKREWVQHIVEYSDRAGIPVFMKDSLVPIVGEENMRREFPWRKMGGEKVDE